MTIKWGDPIECNGVRPDWLRDDAPCAIDQGDGLLDNDWTAEEWSWWDGIRAFYLPADHPAYAALARGFTPWSGGDSAPDDWDEGEVLSRGAGIFKHAEGMDWRYAHTGNGPVQGDIIGYRKRVEYGAVHADGSRSGGQPPRDTVEVRRMTEAEARDWIMNHTYTESEAHILHALEQLGLVETTAERFTRETGHAVTEAVEAALNWKGE